MSTLVQIAVFIALAGIVALVTFMVLRNAHEPEDQYQGWMDYEKWRQNK